jgi:hypothetical protein
MNIMDTPVANPTDGITRTESKVLMKAEHILAMTENNPSFPHEEATTEQQGETTRKKKPRKKKATTPGAVSSKSAELSSKECEQQGGTPRKKKPRKKNATEPGALAMTETTEKQGETTRKKKKPRKKNATEPGAAVSSKSAELSSKECEDSAQQVSSSAKEHQASSRQNEPSKNASSSSKSASSASPPTYLPAENTRPPEASSKAAPGATRVNGTGATHHDGTDIEEGGLKMIDTVEAAEESESPPVEAQDGTVTATAIARDDLEQEIRDKLFAEAVEADVIELGSSSTHKNRKWMILSCILLLLIIVGAVVVGVVVATTGTSGEKAAEFREIPSGGDNDPTTPSAPLLDYLKSQSPDGGVALSNLASPQHKAFVWLLGETPENEQGEPIRPEQFEILLSRYAMATLYYSTGGEDWTQSENWLSTSHISTWYPSESNEVDENQKVLKRLKLGGNNLIGTLPGELVFLVNLKELDLSENKLTNKHGNHKASFLSLSNLGKEPSACISNR